MELHAVIQLVQNKQIFPQLYFTNMPGNKVVYHMKYPCSHAGVVYIHGLVQDCSNSSALAMELLQSCAKPSISS